MKKIVLSVLACFVLCGSCFAMDTNHHPKEKKQPVKKEVIKKDFKKSDKEVKKHKNSFKKQHITYKKNKHKIYTSHNKKYCHNKNFKNL